MPRRVDKCSECRRLKQKCTPLNRHWGPDRGTQEACTGCQRGDRPCSPPERVKKGQAEKVRRPQGTPNMAPVGQGRVESCGEEGESVDLVAADEMRRSKQCLDELLRDVDYTKKAIEELELTVKSLVAHKGPPHLGDAYGVLATRNALSEVLNATKLDLHTKLGKVEVLADQFSRKGDTNTAERAYLRVLQGHYSPAFTTPWEFLSRIANYYFEKEELIQGEKCLKRILDLPTISDSVRDETFQRMAKSMKTSSEKIGQIIKSNSAATV